MLLYEIWPGNASTFLETGLKAGVAARADILEVLPISSLFIGLFRPVGRFLLLLPSSEGAMAAILCGHIVVGYSERHDVGYAEGETKAIDT